MSEICSPANICTTCGQRASGVGSPASICNRCARQECLESAALPAFAARVARELQELAALPAFAADVRGRNAWNLQPCQQLQHMWPRGFRSWQSCQHLNQMCAARTSGICSPASSGSTCGQRASGVGSPASICSRCVWQECLESAILPTFATHGVSNMSGLPTHLGSEPQIFDSARNASSFQMKKGAPRHCTGANSV